MLSYDEGYSHSSNNPSHHYSSRDQHSSRPHEHDQDEDDEDDSHGEADDHTYHKAHHHHHQESSDLSLDESGRDNYSRDLSLSTHAVIGPAQGPDHQHEHEHDISLVDDLDTTNQSLLDSEKRLGDDEDEDEKSSGNLGLSGDALLRMAEDEEDENVVSYLTYHQRRVPKRASDAGLLLDQEDESAEHTAGHVTGHEQLDSSKPDSGVGLEEEEQEGGEEELHINIQDLQRSLSEEAGHDNDDPEEQALGLGGAGYVSPHPSYLEDEARLAATHRADDDSHDSDQGGVDEDDENVVSSFTWAPGLENPLDDDDAGSDSSVDAEERARAAEEEARLRAENDLALIALRQNSQLALADEDDDDDDDDEALYQLNSHSHHESPQLHRQRATASIGLHGVAEDPSRANDDDALSESGLRTPERKSPSGASSTGGRSLQRTDTRTNLERTRLHPHAAISPPGGSAGSGLFPADPEAGEEGSENDEVDEETLYTEIGFFTAPPSASEEGGSPPVLVSDLVGSENEGDEEFTEEEGEGVGGTPAAAESSEAAAVSASEDVAADEDQTKASEERNEDHVESTEEKSSINVDEKEVSTNDDDETHQDDSNPATVAQTAEKKQSAEDEASVQEDQAQVEETQFVISQAEAVNVNMDDDDDDDEKDQKEDTASVSSAHEEDDSSDKRQAAGAGDEGDEAGITITASTEAQLSYTEAGADTETVQEQLDLTGPTEQDVQSGNERESEGEADDQDDDNSNETKTTEVKECYSDLMARMMKKHDERQQQESYQREQAQREAEEEAERERERRKNEYNLFIEEDDGTRRYLNIRHSSMEEEMRDVLGDSFHDYDEEEMFLFMDFLIQLLRLDPEERLTPTAALEHPYMTYDQHEI